MALLEQVLVLGAQRHHRAHVDIVERREHRGGILRILQTSAMVWRSRLIVTRSSRPGSPMVVGTRSSWIGTGTGVDGLSRRSG